MKTLTALLVALMLAGCGVGSATTESASEVESASEAALTVLTGTLTLWGEGVNYYPQIHITDPDYTWCEGSTRSGYGDIDEGAQVVVRDGSGTTLAVSHLDAGEYHQLDEDGNVVKRGEGENSLQGVCVLPFEVELPPEPADFYSVEVADRGEVSFSHADLEAVNYDVAVELGD